MRAARLRRFENAPYATIYAEQQREVAAIAEGTAAELLLLGTHQHVITVGRRGNQRNLLLAERAKNPQLTTPQIFEPKIFEIERGGDVTYHGPGQLVGYPLINLRADPGKPIDLHRYLRDLEEVQIETLTALGIRAERKKDYTGVWVGGGERKIASIGIAVRHWVTFHGFALNINTDLNYFSLLKPCGLDGAMMTSIKKELHQEIAIETVAPLLLTAFRQIFGIEFK